MAVTPQSFLYLGLLALMWGSSYALIKIMVESIPAVTSTALRMIIGTLLVVVLAMAMRQRWPRGWRNWFYLLIIGTAGSAVPFTLIAFAVERIPSASTAILMASIPLFTAILAHLATRDDRLSANKAAGITLGLIGVVILIGPEHLGGIGRSALGMGAGLLAALSYAFTNIVARRVTQSSPLGSGAASFLCSLVVIVPWAFVAERPLDWLGRGDVSTASIVALVLLGVFSSALGNVVFFRLVNLSGSTFVSLNNYLSPIVGVFWGLVLLGETPGWRAFAALALILTGIAVANWTAVVSLVRLRGQAARSGTP
ncbi:MAG: DMT family transporter [Alphaproteobacteria bacterium]|nr:DMT family transporter [Alphaproteobacteria bacterium]